METHKLVYREDKSTVISPNVYDTLFILEDGTEHYGIFALIKHLVKKEVEEQLKK